MSSQDDHRKIANWLKSDQSIVATAQKMYDTAKARTGPGSGLDIGEGKIGLAAICTFLAKKDTRSPQDVTQAQKLSCLSWPLFEKTKTIVERALANAKQDADRRNVVTFKTLASDFGIGVVAVKEMEDLVAWLKELDPKSKFNKPTIVYPIFSWVCRLMQLPVNDRVLRERSTLNRDEWATVRDNLENKCAEKRTEIEERATEAREAAKRHSSKRASTTSPTKSPLVEPKGKSSSSSTPSKKGRTSPTKASSEETSPTKSSTSTPTRATRSSSNAQLEGEEGPPNSPSPSPSRSSTAPSTRSSSSQPSLKRDASTASIQSSTDGSPVKKYRASNLSRGAPSTPHARRTNAAAVVVGGKLSFKESRRDGETDDEDEQEGRGTAAPSTIASEPPPSQLDGDDDASMRPLETEGTVSGDDRVDEMLLDAELSNSDEEPPSPSKRPQKKQQSHQRQNRHSIPASRLPETKYRRPLFLDRAYYEVRDKQLEKELETYEKFKRKALAQFRDPFDHMVVT